MTNKKAYISVLIGFALASLSFISFGFFPLAFIFLCGGLRWFFLTIKDLEKVIGLYVQEMQNLKEITKDASKSSASFFRQSADKTDKDCVKSDVEETCRYTHYDDEAQRLITCGKLLSEIEVHTITDGQVSSGDLGSEELQSISENSIMVAHYCEEHCPKNCTRGCK